MGIYANTSPCIPYLTPADLLGCCKVAGDNLTETDPRLLDAIEDASLIVYYLTGRQFDGTCTRVVRPCLDCSPHISITSNYTTSDSFGCSCSVCVPNQVNLGYWPVTELNSVRENGVTLSGANLTGVYHMDEYRYLVKDDGTPFSGGSSFALTGGPHDTDAGDDQFVVEVSVEVGLPVPRLIERATRALACELVTACLDLPCKLPERVTSVARSGITMQVSSATDLLTNGRTGIYEVDLAISTFNPSKMQSPSFFWSGQTRNGRTVNT